MDLQAIYAKFVAIKEEASQGHIVTATENAALVLVDLCEFGKQLGFKATPEDIELGKGIMIVIAGTKEFSIPVGLQAAEPVGKLGDGVLLKILLEAAEKWLPIILPLIIGV